MLEARDRLGGRIYTQHTLQYPVELGAEFVHGRPEEILSLAAEAGVPIVPVQGNFCRKANGSWVNAGGLMAEVDQLFSSMPADAPDQSFRHYLDRTGASEEVRQQALRYVEGFHAANPSVISVQSLVRDSRAEEAISGDHQYRMANGYEQLMNAVLHRIDRQLCQIVTNSVVNEIRWQKGQVVVRTSSAEFQAPRAIITLPLGVLKGNSVTFSPPLPEKQNAISFLGDGAGNSRMPLFLKQILGAATRNGRPGVSIHRRSALPHMVVKQSASQPHTYRMGRRQLRHETLRTKP